MSVPAWLLDRVQQAVASPAPTMGQRAARGFLVVAAAGYGAAVGLRNAAYNSGLLRGHRLPCRVICIGNLTTGGTGKTPATMLLARRLVEAGVRPAILLRGYGRGGGTGIDVVSDGRTVRLGWREAGDEAVLLARRLPEVPVIVGGDRVQAGRLAIERFGAEVLLLDDGFQHRRLQRDVDVVLLDATDPFGLSFLLPRGRLREPARGLRRAQAVLVTRVDQAGGLHDLRLRIASLAPDLPVGCAVHRPGRLTDLRSGRGLEPSVLKGARVFAMSGIANAESFLGTLRELGGRIAGSRAFPDHHPYTVGELSSVQEEARAAGAEWVLTTEKDAVRLGGQLPGLVPIGAVGIDLEIVEGGAELSRLLGVSVS